MYVLAMLSILFTRAHQALFDSRSTYAHCSSQIASVPNRLLKTCSAVIALWITIPYASIAAEVDFAKDIRPILSQHCFKCHGPDENSRQGGLRLDERSAALKVGDSGLAAITPNDVSKSELLVRIGSSDADVVMPPPSTKKTLTDQQKELIKQWIAQGANYSEHWAFTSAKPRTIEPSTVNGQASNSAIDAMIERRAREAGLEIAPQADRPTWLRRIALDLLGTPPTFDQVDAFVKDQRPDAKERVVDRLLASPAFGERWGRRWLDLARYADTNGYEKDRPRSIWPYRDWVLRAINSDMPLSDFTVKQIAGDLLPDASDDDRIATGFHRNTMTNEEGGIDPLEYRFYAMVDRVNTTSTTWLGLTMGCVQCHDHKYDPITQKDYYSLMALLNDAEEPELEITDPSVAAAQRAADEEIDALARLRASAYPVPLAQLKWQPAKVHNVRSAQGISWSKVNNSEWSSGKPAEKIQTDTITIETHLADDASKDRQLVAIKLRAFDPDYPSQASSRQNSKKATLGWSKSKNFVITSASLSGKSSADLLTAKATYNQPGFDAAGTLDNDPKTGWAVGGRDETTCEVVWFLSRALSMEEAQSTVELVLAQEFGEQHLLRAFELSVGYFDGSADQLQMARSENLQQSALQWLNDRDRFNVHWQLLKPEKANANMALLEPQADGSYLAIGDISKRDEYVFQSLNVPSGTTGLMIETLTDPSMPKRGPGRVYYEGPIGDFFLSEVSVFTEHDERVELGNAWADFAQKGREPDKVFDADPLTGWAIDGRQGEPHRLVIAFKGPLSDSKSKSLQLKLLFERYYAAPIGRVRLWSTTSKLSDTCANQDPIAQNRLHEVAHNKSSTDSRQPLTADVIDLFLAQSPDVAAVNKRIAQTRDRRPKPITTLVMQPRPKTFPRVTHRYHRGEFLNPRESVSPATPAFLQKQMTDAPTDRLGFARWLVNPQHPLVARVMANRYWANLMGRGIVSTEEDFGFQGAFPTHPEVLDWLAAELVGDRTAGGDPELMWSFKRWVRGVVLSDAYGRSSDVSEKALEKDPANTYLARSNRRRLEGEQLRDSALAAAGLLTRRLGGPSIFPPQPASITTEGTYGKFQWEVSRGADRYRRGIYTYSKRTAPFAMLQTFDAPSGEACLARREASDTSLQALTVLNDETFMEASKELGYLAVEGLPSESPGAIVGFLFRRILLREPHSDEYSTLTRYFEQQKEAAGKDDVLRDSLGAGNAESQSVRTDKSKSSAARAAATLVARALLNTDEFINRN